jgi:hypothetical protein
MLMSAGNPGHPPLIKVTKTLRPLFLSLLWCTELSLARVSLSTAYITRLSSSALAWFGWLCLVMMALAS